MWWYLQKRIGESYVLRVVYREEDGDLVVTTLYPGGKSGMKVRYDREEDILLIEIMPDGIIDHAEQADSLIAHFTAEGRRVLLEILDASRFLTQVFHGASRGEETLV